VRPRVPKVHEAIMAREKALALHKLADEVARALDTSPVDGIVISSDFNAGLGQGGRRRRRILHLGLPLVSILNGEERVALLAHELAHSVNGDPNRGFFVGTAISSLAQWHYLLRPNRIWQRQPHGTAISSLEGSSFAGA
jgi:heat shock protein HtpX